MQYPPQEQHEKEHAPTSAADAESHASDKKEHLPDVIGRPPVLRHLAPPAGVRKRIKHQSLAIARKFRVAPFVLLSGLRPFPWCGELKYTNPKGQSPFPPLLGSITFFRD